VAQVLTQEGGLALWRQILQITPLLGTPKVHLIGASHTVVHADTETTLAALELAASGYAPVGLVSGNWTLAAIADGAQVNSTPINWTFTSAASVYGYWISDGSSTYSLFGETFANPFLYGPLGGTFTLQLSSYLVSQPFTLGPCF
jgi:hypothetical protein